ncbi:E4 orf6 [Simian adenovirus A1139]|uniref:E4 orf6 n=1 Tax=Simian adenovirus A1139 TaxID=1159186 RepID=H9AAA2_9ADEN|nr:E4 orf6 [Simian adenovirus A1139]
MQRERRFRYRLGPYARHRLPPCEQPCSAAVMDDSQLSMDCDNFRMHNVAEVRGLPCCAGFIVLQEWPVLWDMVLTRWELYVLRTYLRVCVCCATLDVESRQLVHGHERWILHCHCRRPGSLQCKAGAVVLTRWFKMLVYGALINQRCLWYREVVNFNLPKEVCYVGSTYVRGRHLIYVRIRYDGHVGVVLANMSFGWSVLSYGILNNLVILGCTYCKDLSEIQMRCCARRTRALMLRAVRLIGEHTRSPLYRSRLEPRRQQLLRNLMLRAQPFTLSAYDGCENPWRSTGSD